MSIAVRFLAIGRSANAERRKILIPQAEPEYATRGEFLFCLIINHLIVSVSVYGSSSILFVLIIFSTYLRIIK